MLLLTGAATDLNIRANLIEQHSPPDLLVHNILTEEDVEKLFDLWVALKAPYWLSLTHPTRFYKHINVSPFWPLPSSTFADHRTALHLSARSQDP